MGVTRTTSATPSPQEPGRGRGPAIKTSATPTFLESVVTAWAVPDLRRRISFVFAMFGIYVVGLHVPMPGLDRTALSNFFNTGGGGNLLNLIDVFSGGALRNFTVLAMGIVPYINASIIMQLLTFAIPEWQELSREGETGRKRIAQYTRYLTVALGFVQACGLTMMFWTHNIVSHNALLAVYIVVTLLAGTSFLMWLGEMISDKGIGNGVSLIIFAGIMVRLPQQILSVGKEIGAGSVTPLQGLVLLVSFFVTTVGIIFVTLGQRRVPIQHVRRIVGNKMTQGGMSYMPFRIASAGVIPIIFAISLVMLPLTFAQYVQDNPLKPWSFNHIIHLMSNWFDPSRFSVGGLLSSLFYAALIIGFTYFYTAITLDIPHIAEDLKKYGSFIPGIRPGRPTEDYLDRVITRLTLAGSLFLALVALLNYWVPAMTNTSHAFTLVGGTSLLIVVGVALDTMQAIEAQLLMRHYEGFIR